jgi:hypothetical protein
MYQVKVYNRHDGSLVMESELFTTLLAADVKIAQIGQGEGYYSVILKTDAVWSDLVKPWHPDSMITA